MKKFIVTTLILTLALFIFPLSSFGEEALVCPREPGQDIQGLVFDFSELGALPIDLPDKNVNWEEFWITCVKVQAQGGELIIVTSSGRYNYDAKLDGGEIFATDDIDAKCDPEVDPIKEWTRVWTFEFDSATLNEHFIINDNDKDYIMDEGCAIARTFEPPYGTPLDLFFKVKKATLIYDDSTNSQPFNLMLKLNDSLPQIYKLKW